MRGYNDYTFHLIFDLVYLSREGRTAMNRLLSSKLRRSHEAVHQDVQQQTLIT